MEKRKVKNRYTNHKVRPTGKLLTHLDFCNAQWHHLVVVNDFVCYAPSHVDDLEVNAKVTAEPLQLRVGDLRQHISLGLEV